LLFIDSNKHTESTKSELLYLQQQILDKIDKNDETEIKKTLLEINEKNFQYLVIFLT